MSARNIENVVIIIPTYNEEGTITATIELLQKETAAASNFRIDILVFDSHSSDNTLACVEALKAKYPNIYLLQEPYKTGLGSAYRQAMHYAIHDMQADIVFEFDADGSHQPKYILPMLNKMAEGYDVVVGSRYVPGGSIPQDWAWHRRFLSRMGNVIAQTVLSRKYKDYTSGFRATRTRFLKKIDTEKLFSKNYAYKIDLFWKLHGHGAKILEYPIEFIDREVGYSKFPRNNVIESLYVVLALRLNRYFKMGLVGITGMVVQLMIFNILRKLLPHPVLANVFAVEIAIICNFILNNKFTFRDRLLQRSLKNWTSKFLQFNSLSLTAILVQSLSILIGTTLFGRSFWIDNIFVLLGAFIGSIYNYFMYNMLIWKAKSSET